MGKRIDLTGERFGRLMVISFSHASESRASYWNVRCDCGNTKIVESYELRNFTRSCGCLRREMASKTKRTHGMTDTPIYRTWGNMKKRCLGVKSQRYKDWGGRGIKVCESWMRFENFYNDMGEKPKGMTLERIDNNKGYFPENCKWATYNEQGNNKRNNRLLTYKGMTKNFTQWADYLKINVGTLQHRIYRGWPIEKTLAGDKNCV